MAGKGGGPGTLANGDNGSARARARYEKSARWKFGAAGKLPELPVIRGIHRDRSHGWQGANAREGQSGSKLDRVFRAESDDRSDRCRDPRGGRDRDARIRFRASPRASFAIIYRSP